MNLCNDILNHILDLKINLTIFIKFLNGPCRLPYIQYCVRYQFPLITTNNQTLDKPILRLTSNLKKQKFKKRLFAGLQCCYISSVPSLFIVGLRFLRNHRRVGPTFSCKNGRDGLSIGGGYALLFVNDVSIL